LNVLIAFTVNSKLCGEDLTSWLETGYDYILDAAVSDGEVDKGQYLVFAEMNRRTSVPERIIEVLEDLEGLTGFKLDDWKIKVNNKIYKADKDALSNVIELSPKEYARLKRKEEKEEKAEDELNQMRDIANLERPITPDIEEPAQPMDAELKEFINRAGL